MTATDALATALAGTDAAVYAYGLVAARLSGAEEARALTAMAEHRVRRDQLRARLGAFGATPSAAAPAYTPPFEVVDASSARRLAGLVEDRLAGQWAGVAGQATGTERATAAGVVQACAVRAVVWTGASPTWSGAV